MFCSNVSYLSIVTKIETQVAMVASGNINEIGMAMECSGICQNDEKICEYAYTAPIEFGYKIYEVHTSEAINILAMAKSNLVDKQQYQELLNVYGYSDERSLSCVAIAACVLSDEQWEEFVNAEMMMKWFFVMICEWLNYNSASLIVDEIVILNQPGANNWVNQPGADNWGLNSLIAMFEINSIGMSDEISIIKLGDFNLRDELYNLTGKNPEEEDEIVERVVIRLLMLKSALESLNGNNEEETNEEQ